MSLSGPSNRIGSGVNHVDVELAQQGDVKAFTRLIEQSQNLVSTIALAIVKDIDDSEEVAQQVFISAWQNLHQLKNSSSFLPWVRQNTRFAALNFLRDNKSKQRIASDQADILLEQIVDHAAKADDKLITADNNATVQAFIDKLPEEDREIVLLYYREEQSSKQVAQLLNLSEANVRKKLSRARQTLRSDIMRKAGHLVYASAPALGFSSLVASLLVPSAPVAAAITSGTMGSKAGSSVLVKFATIFSGAFLGAFFAIIAIVWSSNTAMKNLQQEDKKRLLKKYRNEIIAWVIVFSITYSLAIQLSDGWFVPIAVFFIFILGFAALMYRQMNMLLIHARVLKNGKRVKQSKTQKVFAYGCLVLSVVLTSGVMILSAISSGRAMF